MENLINLFRRRLSKVTTDFKRYLYDEINWKNRLIIIKGARGVGKTTLILQYIKNNFENLDKVIYLSLDHIWFANHTLLEFVEYFYTHGGTDIFLDEVHRYPHWQQEVKNIYDFYPDLHIVVTASSMLRIEKDVLGDLSRRARQYTLAGLSFREYLELEGISLPVLTFEDILSRHASLASDITSRVKILPYFEEYLKKGYYPFYREEDDDEGFGERLRQVADTIIESEIPALSDIEYSSVYKIRRLLSVISAETPYVLNVTNLVKSLDTTRNTIIKLLSLLDKAALIRSLYAVTTISALARPEKILFDNTNYLYAFSTPNIGTVRETFFASQMAKKHKVIIPKSGDFLVDGRFLFEVGGRKKKFSQIKDIPDSYVVADEIEAGYGNKIPLWLFGLMY